MSIQRLSNVYLTLFYEQAFHHVAVIEGLGTRLVHICLSFTVSLSCCPVGLGVCALCWETHLKPHATKDVNCRSAMDDSGKEKKPCSFFKRSGRRVAVRKRKHSSSDEGKLRVRIPRDSGLQSMHQLDLLSL